jgi:hypothetical protein
MPNIHAIQARLEGASGGASPSSKLRSLRECSAQRSPRSRSSAAMPIGKCSLTARW